MVFVLLNRVKVRFTGLLVVLVKVACRVMGVMAERRRLAKRAMRSPLLADALR